MPFPPVCSGPGIPDAEIQSIHAIDQSQGSPEVALNQKVNQKVKNLIQQLGEAIHESVSESENIAGVVKDLRDQGFDVLLMLEATIGLNEVEAESEDVLELSSEDAVGPFTRNDLTFLKSLRISLPEEASGSSEPPPASD
jgi:hypothetical protein